MSKLAYFRVFGYLFTVILHVSHLTYMAINHGDTSQHPDPKIREFGSVNRRYYTCWNFFLQILYACIGLVCEWMTFRNSSVKDYELPKRLRGLRDTLFAGILWPSTWLVFTVFWSLFTYDRDLIFPAFVDQILTPLTNHIIHTFIVPIVVWEVLFRPRTVPKNHGRNIYHLMFYMTLYLGIMIYTFYERGLWLYPIFKLAYGSVYFYVILAIMFGATVIFYYAQWILTWLVHGDVVIKHKTKRKVK